ncbi:MAG: signal peptidase I [Oscillospiraceae bacterium]
MDNWEKSSVPDMETDQMQLGWDGRISTEEQPEEIQDAQPPMPPEEQAAPDKERFNLKNEVYEWVESLVYSLVVVVLLFTFVFRIVGVDGNSMLPTLHNEDRVILTNLFYEPKQGDIVVVTQPNERNEPIIKRIIATGGQEVNIDFQKHEVYVDGELLQEDYILAPTRLSYDVKFPVTVPEGKVFVMGDNRNDSWDSRSTGVGFIDERYILGEAVFRVFPFNSLGLLN